MARARGYEIQQTEDGLHYFIETDTTSGRSEAEKPSDLPEEDLGKVRVFIGDILTEVSEDDIREFCTIPVQNVKYVRRKTKTKRLYHAYVTFASSTGATWAVQYLNGASLCGGVVRVEYPKVASEIQ